jgi:sRNA-binding regulator protein Hfq
MNRKLIRPSFSEVKNNEREVNVRRNEGQSYSKPVSPRPPAPPASDGSTALPPSKSKKMPPPIETNAEVFYYKKQIDTHTPMVIVLQDGEEIEGTIEWYDRRALKINCTKGPNLMLLKHNIKYMFKAEDREPLDGGNEK